MLLDVHLPDGGGVAVLEALAGCANAPRVLALSVSDAAEDVVPMIRAGALGYVTKTIDTDELLTAIATVAAGEACFSPRLAAFVLQAFSAPARPASPELEALTPREREVLHHLARGYSYKRIAARLGHQRPHRRVARRQRPAQAAAHLAPRGQPLGGDPRARRLRGRRRMTPVCAAPPYHCTVCTARWEYAEIRYVARCKRCGAGLTRTPTCTTSV